MISGPVAVLLMCASVFLVVVAHKLEPEWGLLIVITIVLLAWAASIIG